MSAGRYAMRGRVFQGRAFAPWALAGAGVVDGITTRVDLIGTSQQRYAIKGTSLERGTLYGTTEERLSLRGSSK